MDDIAEAAGVSKPVLYQHFPGKLELYLALLDGSSDALLTSLDDALASTADNKLRVQATVAAYFDFVDDPRGAFRLIFESDLTNEPGVRARVDRANDACAAALSKVINEDTGLTEAEATLLEGPQTLLQALGERATDRHRLAHRLHLRAEHSARTGQLLERPPRDLRDDVVDRGLEARRRRVGLGEIGRAHV